MGMFLMTVFCDFRPCVNGARALVPSLKSDWGLLSMRRLAQCVASFIGLGRIGEHIKTYGNPCGGMLLLQPAVSLVAGKLCGLDGHSFQC